MIDDLVPIVLFLTIGAGFGLAIYFRYRTRHDIQNTVRAAVERGDPLSPELIEALATSVTSPHADLRKGVIALAFGAAFYLMGFFIGEPDAIGPIAGVSMFPILIGLAYLGLWFFIGRGRERTASARAAG